MTTRLQRWRDTTFEREVRGVVLVAANRPENQPATVAVGGTLQLEPRMSDTSHHHPMRYHTAPTFAYESDDENVATVDEETGLVTAVHAGDEDASCTITVTATTPAAQEFEGTLAVTVLGDVIPDSVTVAPATADLAPEDTQQLTATVKNANGDTLAGEEVTWESDEEGFATVDAAGLVTAIADGVATITATSVTDPSLTDTCVVTVATP